jgi:hypothetical protein
MKELIEGKNFYYNKEGLFVFTEHYHLEKGYCCGNGCLHCPYNYKNVNKDQLNGNADNADTTDMADLVSE